MNDDFVVLTERDFLPPPRTERVVRGHHALRVLLDGGILGEAVTLEWMVRDDVLMSRTEADPEWTADPWRDARKLVANASRKFYVVREPARGASDESEVGGDKHA